MRPPAALAGGAGFTLWNAVSYASAVSKAEGSVKGSPTSGADLNRDVDAVRTSFVGLAVCYSVALVAAAGAGVTGLFTDWDNVRGAE